MKSRTSLYLAAVIGAAIPGLANAQGVAIGPSTQIEPYLLPTTGGIITKSLLTVGEAVGGYRLVGVPDGAGIWEGVGSTFNYVSNHELQRVQGTARAHGSRGAFVSRWVIDRDGRIISGRDHATSASNILTWNGNAYTPGTTAIDRLCSADLAKPGAYLWDTYFGTEARIFLSGEETGPPFAGDHGRAFAHVLTGPDANKSFELPRMGKIAYENLVASPYPQSKTIVMLLDDGGRDTDVTRGSNVCRTEGQIDCIEPPSQAFVYIGTKQPDASKYPGAPRLSDIEEAGLTNGSLYGLRVRRSAGGSAAGAIGAAVAAPAPAVGNQIGLFPNNLGPIVSGENKDFVFSNTAPAVTTARFELVNLGDVSRKSGVQQQDEAMDAQITQFIRIEDGAWDPRPGKQNDFYFVTTGRISATETTYRPSRLWRLRFDDVTRPEAGGTIEMILTSRFYPNANATPDADPSYQMFDNLTIDRLGRIILQEDVGGNPRLGRMYVYGIDTGRLVEIARHNWKFFSGSASTNPNFLTIDEESSGVVEAWEQLGQGWYMVNVQSHNRLSDAELVEGGQIDAIFIDTSIAR